ncbi:MAG: CNNM domain-containing protein, partial [Candidatus Omnitrophica bacterium]|nr:CNNM domain-containing protein [Candidatus Omnitrophota bacterium]
MIGLEIALLFCLMAAAFLAGSEMAFISANRLKLRELADKGNRSAALMLQLYERPDHFLAVLLVATNLAMVSATALFTVIMKTGLKIENEWLVTAVMAPVFIIFAEMVPKDYCRLRSQEFLLRYVGLLKLLSVCFHYPTLMILKGVEFLLKPLGSVMSKSIFVDEEEFRSLIEESTKSGVVTHQEKQLINTILDFERIRVDAVMMPVDKAPKISITGNISEVKDLARKARSKMILVYEELPSIIVGMIYVFDILFVENNEEGLKNYLRSPIFLPCHTSIEKAFL